MSFIQYLYLFVTLIDISGVKAVPVELLKVVTSSLSSYCRSDSEVETHFLVDGLIDSSDVWMIMFEKMDEKFRSHIVCLQDFHKLCVLKTKLNCYCTSTENQNIFNIMLNITVTDTDEYRTIRAAVVKRNGEKQNSNTVTLPTTFETVILKDLIDLQVNKHEVDINNCSAITNNSIIEINNNSTRTELVSFRIINSTSFDVVRKSNFEIRIQNKLLNNSQISFTLQFYFCHQIFYNVTCTIITVYKFENVNTENDQMIETLRLICILLLVICVPCWIICYFISTKQNFLVSTSMYYIYLMKFL
ncbi:uncharacterized protein LOC129922910 [Biomphalaria glabrata]|uniref:Uncharacterized protein LOC129922910 n=1 Tax=Biomphalaria glabrata TaxID=6526 RepID=A0A9W2YWG3_BIOGL|nr:uncharacterized protein LOC129922910 [Biomphalaria glabrata]